MLIPGLISLCLVTGCLATNPGAKIRVTRPGLNYAAAVAVDILSDAVGKLSIPDVRGKTDFGIGNVEFDVTSIKVTGFQKPSTRVDVGPGSLTWQCADATVWLHGNWHYKLQAAFIPISDSGSFDGDTSGVSVSVQVHLGMDPATGRPNIASTNCYAHVSDIHIKLHGGASWLYNLFINQVIAPVRGDLERLICKEARKAIDNDAERELSTLPVQVEIDHQWELDYRLVDGTILIPDNLETHLKGEFFAKGDTSEAPFQPAVLPNPPSTERMVMIFLSDYLLNTAGYVLYKRSILHHNVTAKDLPPEDRGFLDVTCRSIVMMCIGGMLPAVKKLYPNATVELEMAVDEAPKAVISSAEIEGSFVGWISYGARLADGSLKYLFRTSVKTAVSLTAQLDNMVVKGKINKLTPTIAVTDSAIGPIPDAKLQGIFNVSKTFIIRSLNKVGEKGFAIPVIKHVRFVNTELSLQPNALQISTDVLYQA